MPKLRKRPSPRKKTTKNVVSKSVFVKKLSKKDITPINSTCPEELLTNCSVRLTRMSAKSIAGELKCLKSTSSANMNPKDDVDEITETDINRFLASQKAITPNKVPIYRRNQSLQLQIAKVQLPKDNDIYQFSFDESSAVQKKKKCQRKAAPIRKKKAKTALKLVKVAKPEAKLQKAELPLDQPIRILAPHNPPGIESNPESSVPEFETENNDSSENLEVPRNKKVPVKKYENHHHSTSTPIIRRKNVSNNMDDADLLAKSPWRVNEENRYPKTFYFSYANDMLPSYSSDLIKDDTPNRSIPTKVHQQQKIVAEEPLPISLNYSSSFENNSNAENISPTLDPKKRIEVVSNIILKPIIRSPLKQMEIIGLLEEDESLKVSSLVTHSFTASNITRSKLKRFESTMQSPDKSNAGIQISTFQDENISTLIEKSNTASKVTRRTHAMRIIESTVQSFDDASTANSENQSSSFGEGQNQSTPVAKTFLASKITRRRQPMKTIEIVLQSTNSSAETQPDKPSIGQSTVDTTQPESPIRSEASNNTSNSIEHAFGFDTTENFDEVITDDEMQNHSKDVLIERLKSLKRHLPRQSTKTTRIPHQVVTNLFHSPKKVPNKQNDIRKMFDKKFPSEKTSTPRNVRGRTNVSTDVADDISVVDSNASGLIHEDMSFKLFDDPTSPTTKPTKQIHRRSYNRVTARKRKKVVGFVNVSDDDSDMSDYEESKAKKKAVRTKKKPNIEDTAAFKEFVTETNKEFEEVAKYKFIIN